MEYRNDEYVITNKISDYNIKEMRNNMDENDVAEFDKFIERNWGKQNVGVVAQGDPQPARRGRPKKA